jgi:hypothetical protein
MSKAPATPDVAPTLLLLIDMMMRYEPDQKQILNGTERRIR